MQGGALHPVSFYKYWGCSAPLSKILGVLEHLQHPPSYAPDSDEELIVWNTILEEKRQQGDPRFKRQQGDPRFKRQATGRPSWRSTVSAPCVRSTAPATAKYGRPIMQPQVFRGTQSQNRHTHPVSMIFRFLLLYIQYTRIHCCVALTTGSGWPWRWSCFPFRHEKQLPREKQEPSKSRRCKS